MLVTLILCAVSAFGLIDNALAQDSRIDQTLLGCWRSQETERHFADGQRSDSNQDCVTLISAKTIQSSCNFAKGPFQSASSYVPTGPGRLAVTSLSSTLGPAPVGPTREMQYQVDGNWLMTMVTPARSGDSEQDRNAPVQISGVLVRVKDNDPIEKCAPSGHSDAWQRGVSSLNLSPPPRFDRLELDPQKDASLQKDVENELVIGFFKRSDQRVPSGPLSAHMADTVKVTEELSYGAKPVTSNDFEAMKKRARDRLTAQEVWCDTPQKLCVELRIPNPDHADQVILVGIAFVLVRGRIAVINARSIDSGSASELFTHHAADAFANQLVGQNP